MVMWPAVILVTFGITPLYDRILQNAATECRFRFSARAMAWLGREGWADTVSGERKENG